MPDAAIHSLKGWCLLVVEDEYLIAADLTASLEDLGVRVIGPAASVKEALRLIAKEGERLNGALLDINLRGEHVYPVADALAARDLPFIFTTGYADLAISDRYMDRPRCEKPVDTVELVRELFRAASQPAAF